MKGQGMCAWIKTYTLICICNFQVFISKPIFHSRTVVFTVTIKPFNVSQLKLFTEYLLLVLRRNDCFERSGFKRAKVGRGENAAISYPVNGELNGHKGTFALI